MKWLLVGLLSGLAFVAVGRRVRSSADDLASAANEAMRHGDHSRAADLLERLVRRGADSPTVAHNHGAALYHLDKPHQASERYEAASGSTYETARAAYDRANCLVLQGQQGDHQALRQAVELYRTCLQTEIGAINGESLHADARHNLELVKLHLSASSGSEQGTTEATAFKENPEEECPS